MGKFQVGEHVLVNTQINAADGSPQLVPDLVDEPATIEVYDDVYNQYWCVFDKALNTERQFYASTTYEEARDVPAWYDENELTRG